MLRPVHRPRPRPRRPGGLGGRLAVTALPLLLAGTPGCVHHVLLLSDPPGAAVERRGELLGPTPIEIDLWRNPLSRQEVTVRMTGYRTVQVRIDRRLGWFRARTTQQLLLIPEHGPAGTWTPEDARKAR